MYDVKSQVRGSIFENDIKKTEEFTPCNKQIVCIFERIDNLSKINGSKKLSINLCRRSKL